jgi:hypothetical protein
MPSTNTAKTARKTAKKEPKKEPEGPTGAASPLEVTHGFTLSAPHWAWLILHGYKIIENRQCRFAPGWYGVHVGQNAYTNVVDELKYHKRFKMPSMFGAKKGEVHGVCKVEAGVPYEQCKDNEWAIKDFKICNIITKVILFDGGDTAKARGNFGTWRLKESEARVRQLTKEAIQLGHLKKTNAKEVLGRVFDTVDNKAAPIKGKRPAEEAPKAEEEPGPAVKKAKPPVVKDPESPKAGVPVTDNGKKDIRSFFLKK